MAEEKYYYPESVALDINKARSFTFTIYDQSTLTQGVTKAIEKFKDLAANLNTREIVDASTPEVMLSNLEANATPNLGEMICSITLPLPNSLSDNQNHKWDTTTSIAGGIGTQLNNVNLLDNSLTEAAGLVGGVLGGFNEISDGDSNLKKAGKVGIGAMLGLAVGKAARSSDISLDKLMAQTANNTGQRKQIVDPGYFQNYTGSEPRSFTFSYDLVPKNTEEATQIYMIVSKFKQYSSPSLFMNLPVLTAPYYFKIQNSSSFIGLLMGLDQVVLTNISVEYGADGAMELFSDGVPKFIKLSLTFTESRVRTADDYYKIQTKDIHEDIQED